MSEQTAVARTKNHRHSWHFAGDEPSAWLHCDCGASIGVEEAAENLEACGHWLENSTARVRELEQALREMMRSNLWLNVAQKAAYAKASALLEVHP